MIKTPALSSAPHPDSFILKPQVNRMFFDAMRCILFRIPGKSLGSVVHFFHSQDIFFRVTEDRLILSSSAPCRTIVSVYTFYRESFETFNAYPPPVQSSTTFTSSADSHLAQPSIAFKVDSRDFLVISKKLAEFEKWDVKLQYQGGSQLQIACMNKDSDFTRYSVNEIPVYQMGALDEETDFFEVLNSRGTLARFFINARISNYQGTMLDMAMKQFIQLETEAEIEVDVTLESLCLRGSSPQSKTTLVEIEFENNLQDLDIKAVHGICQFKYARKHILYILGRLSSAQLEVKITETGTMIISMRTPKLKWVYAMGALTAI